VAKARREWVPGVASWLQKNFGVAEGAGKGTGTGTGTGTDTGTGAGVAGVAVGPGPAPPDGRKLRFKQLENGGLELDLRDLRIEVIDKGSGRYVVRAAPPTPPAQGFEKRLRQVVSGLVKSSEEGINSLVKLGQKALVGLLSALTTMILTFMISAFLLIDTRRIIGGLRSLVDGRYHADFDAVVQQINRGLSGAIRGQLLICIVNGVLTWIGLKIFGVKYSFLLALTAGLMSLIPIFGSILSTIPIVLVALASSQQGVDLVAGVGMLVWIVGIHLVEANLLNPKIIGTAAKIHPVIVIFAVVAGERTYGAMGALLAVPIVSAVQAVFFYIRARVRGPEAPAAPVEPSA
ncbi:MAG: AI-2E family transporter, partial [Myxococcales bacterium]|nr:AI-2E family transporter [Myxococcales bacterium]